MDKVEEGVSNFRGFQKDARDFFATFAANEEHRKTTDKRRAKIHYALLTLLIGLVIALFTFILNHYDGHKISFDVHSQSELHAPIEDATVHSH